MPLADTTRARTATSLGCAMNGVKDDTRRLQAAAQDACADGFALILDGFAKVSEPILFDCSGITSDPWGGSTRPGLKGYGAGLSRIIGTHAGPILEYRGGGGAGAGALLDWGGFGIQGDNCIAGSIGLKMDNAAYCNLSAIDILTCDIGLYGSDFLSSVLNGVRLRANGLNAKLLRSDFSHPNALSLVGCTVAGGRQGGVLCFSGATLTMIGGSVEGNGLLAGAGGYGVAIDAAGAEGAEGLDISGVYFEGNKGVADIWIVQMTETVLHRIGGSFVRHSAATHVQNNVKVDALAGGASRVVVGAGFRALGDYVEDASRRYITAPPGSVINGGCMFASAAAAPDPSIWGS